MLGGSQTPSIPHELLSIVASLDWEESHPLTGETTSSRICRSPIPSSVVKICTAFSISLTCEGAKCLTCRGHLPVELMP